MRLKNKVSGQQMADTMGISRSTWGNYENGNTEPDTEALKKIADYFHVSLSELIAENLQVEKGLNGQVSTMEEPEQEYTKIRKAELDAMQTLIKSMEKHIERLENQNK